MYIHAESEYGGDIVDNATLIDIRKFVERQAAGDAFITYLNKSHEYCWNSDTAKYTWNKEYAQIYHRYIVINFELEEDTVLFKLIFPFASNTYTEFHPNYMHDTKNCIRY